jgi:hypothetical protein
MFTIQTSSSLYRKKNLNFNFLNFNYAICKLLRGLLATYSMIGTLERNNGKFNYLNYLINLYLRFYPSIFGTILMYYLLPLVGSGPFWHLADTQYVESCRKFLWPNLLSYNYYVLDLEEFVHSSMVCI